MGQARKKIHIGCIGAGIAGRSHIFDIISNGDLQLDALAVKTLKTRNKVQREFTVTNCSTDYRGLLKMEQIEYIVLAVPNDIAPEFAFKILQAGKHLLAEKPLLIFGSDFFKFALLQRISERKISVLYSRRLRKSWRYVRELVREEKMGDILSIEFHCNGPYRQRFSKQGHTFRSDARQSMGGVVIDTVSHLLDLMVFLFGRIGTVVSAQLVTEQSTGLEYMGTIVIDHFNLFRVTVHVSNEDDADEKKTALIRTNDGEIWVDEKQFAMKTANVDHRFADGYLCRPVDVAAGEPKEEHILLTDLLEAKQICTCIQSIYAEAGINLKKKWIFPRAKVLAKRSGAC
ncbi:Gfo/Idh/MocA family protein [Mucilaginibacter psychrotolerans]|nr:Gfo/Idh/MocA family oxidoreductase [Mucilaginibacter psychrotolerans]